jgi:hypothetical protein
MSRQSTNPAQIDGCAQPRQRRKALFGISVDSQSFGTEAVAAALASFVKDFDEVVFLIADRLHLYNRAADVTDAEGYCNLLRAFEKRVAGRESYKAERERWLDRVRSHVEGALDTKWSVVGIDDVADPAYCAIFRNLIVAFNTIVDFRQDVRDCASAHVFKHQTAPTESSLRLSEAYVIEDIALSLRIHVLDRVEAEFYIADYLKPLLRLYDGTYGISVTTIAGSRERPPTYRFYSLSHSGSADWREVWNSEHNLEDA